MNTTAQSYHSTCTKKWLRKTCDRAFWELNCPSFEQTWIPLSQRWFASSYFIILIDQYALSYFIILID